MRSQLRGVHLAAKKAFPTSAVAIAAPVTSNQRKAAVTALYWEGSNLDATGKARFCRSAAASTLPVS